MTPNSRLASIIALMLLLLSCSRPNDGMVRGNKAVNSILDSVESILDDDSHYADSLVRLIDPQSIKGKKLRARYALLYTATQYKEYQPFTSDSLIMEAVRYYSDKKNIDYRFLSYYYLGCVYLELSKISEASVAFAQAEFLVDKIDNDHWKGLLYLRLGFLNRSTCNYIQAREDFIKAEECFGREGRDYYILSAMLNEGQVNRIMTNFTSADSIFQIIERRTLALGDSTFHRYCLFNRLACLLHLSETDLATDLIEKNGLTVDESSNDFKSLLTMSHYYIETKNYAKAESLLDRAGQLCKNEDDSIYYYFFNYRLAYRKGDIDKAFYHYGEFTSIQNNSLRMILNHSVLEAQYNNYKTITELEQLKARNKIITLIASIILIILISSLTIHNKKRQAEERIRDYISSINDLTTQISVNKDKISKLNDKVREMLRQQFNPSDYLYTRYYEQLDDNKKAERLYRVVKNQMEGFTNRKNIDRIDELLNETFDGIMNKVLSSGIDIKEKDLLLLRFVLAGFSSKSIAALLGETHLNVNQRKKRLLDKIQIKDPKLMNELSIALNNK